MLIHLDRATNLLTGDFKPLATNLTVEQAAERLNAMDLPAYVEAVFDTFADVSVSIERQIATKTRRLQKLARLCGRSVVRVERMHGSVVRYRALLAA